MPQNKDASKYHNYQKLYLNCVPVISTSATIKYITDGPVYMHILA